VKIDLEHLRVSDYFAGCVRLFVPKTIELFLSISCNKRAQKAMKGNGRALLLTWVWVFMQCVAVCSEMEQKELHSAALSVQEQGRRKINILWDVTSYLVAFYRRFGGIYCLLLQDVRVEKHCMMWR